MTFDDFNLLFIRHSEMIYKLGLRLFFFSEDKAEDFVQEVYVHSHNKYQTIKKENYFKSWLYKLALNYGLNQIKKNKNEILLDNNSIENRLNIQTSMIDKNLTEKILDIKEKQDLLEDALQSLSKLHRLLLTLYYYEGMKYHEIASHLDLKLGTVKSYISRAKEFLQKELQLRGHKNDSSR